MITRNFEITIRIPEQNYIPTLFQVVENDNDVYSLTIHITDGINEIDYSKVSSATITFLKGDGNVVQGNLTVGENSLTYTMGTNEIACPGKVVASIQLYGEIYERLTTARFSFEVVRDLITPSAVQSTTEFPVLNQKIQEVNNLIEEVQGMEAIKGDKGDPGDSAYQVWLNAGNVGTIEEYFASLKGDQGIQGEQGPPGEKGEEGDPGSDATVTNLNVLNAIGYTPANEEDLGNKLNKSNDVLESYREKLVNLGDGTIDLSQGNVFTHALSANTTYTITNAAAQAHSFTLIITQPATAVTLIFPASVKWQGGTIPSLTAAAKTYVLTFLSVDGGTNWLGMFGGEF